MAQVLPLNQVRKLSWQEVAHKTWDAYKKEPRVFVSKHLGEQYTLSPHYMRKVMGMIQELAKKDGQEWVGRPRLGFATQEYWNENTTVPTKTSDDRQIPLPLEVPSETIQNLPSFESKPEDPALVQEAYYNHIRKFWDDLRDIQNHPALENLSEDIKSFTDETKQHLKKVMDIL